MKCLINKLSKETYAIKLPGMSTKPIITILYNLSIYVIVAVMIIVAFTIEMSDVEVDIKKVNDINYIKSNCDYKSSEPYTYDIQDPERLICNQSYIEALSTLKTCSISKAIDVDYFMGENILSNITTVIKQVCTDYGGQRQILLNYLTQSETSICFKGLNELWFSTGISCVNKSTSMVFKGTIPIIEPMIDTSIWNDVALRCYSTSEWSLLAKFSMIFGIFSIIKFILQGVIKSTPMGYIKKNDKKADLEMPLMGEDADEFNKTTE